MFKELNPLLHSELRLAVMSLLIGVEEADFVFIRQQTGATAGNLSVQIDKLNKAGYVEVTKTFKGKMPCTICKITPQGVDAFDYKIMKANFIIRAALQSDAVELKNLFQNTVLAINRRDYLQAEVEDWASCGDDLSNIEDMIKTHYFIVTVNQQSEIVGFSSITPQGYLHSMFVHKDFQGEGIATMLLNEIEQYAITNGIIRITSEVSLTARPFFEKKGYIVEEEQKRKANQLSLTNFWMAKQVICPKNL